MTQKNGKVEKARGGMGRREIMTLGVAEKKEMAGKSLEKT